MSSVPARSSLSLSRLSLSGLIGAITLAGLLTMAMRVSIDTDTWWHLRAGAWMVAHRAVLTRDVFSSTFVGQAWEYPAWMSETALYQVFAHWGYGGLDLFTAGMVTVAFALVYLTCTGPAYVRAVAVLLGAAASSVFWAARPQIVSIPLAAAFLYVLALFRWRQVNRLWLLPPVMAVWANTHPGFAIGFILLALTGLGEAAKAALGVGRWRTLAWLAAAGLACLLALLLSPYGPGLVVFPFKTLAIGALRDHIQEWQSPNFHMREAQVVIALWLATFAAIGLSRRAIDLTDLCLLGGSLAMALLAGRNIVLFALVAPPVLARHAQGVLDDWRARLPELVTAVEGHAPPTRLGTLLNWLILGLVAMAAVVKVVAVSDPGLNEHLALRDMPSGAVDYIAANHPPGPLYNPYQWGGYLAWRLYPEYGVYVDGRTDLYGDAFLNEYLRLADGAPDWASVLERRGVRLMLVEADAPLATLAAADPQWTRVYHDAIADVFERRP